MKIKIKKIILSIFILFISTFYFIPKANASLIGKYWDSVISSNKAQWEAIKSGSTSLGGTTLPTLDDFRYDYIDLRKFTATNPYDSFGSSNAVTNLEQIKTWKSNDDPHFEVIGDSAAKAKANAFSLIYGLGIFDKATIVKLMKDKSDEEVVTRIFPARNTLSETTEKYVVVHLNYDDHTDIDTLIPGDDASLFLAGAGVKKINNNNFLSTTYDNYSKLLKINDSNLAFINEDQKTNLIKNTNINSGACFTIKPEKIENTCNNSTAQACKIINDSSANTYFLYGITCENLNTLLVDKNSRAKIIDIASTAANSFKTPAERAEINTQLQVPFAGIQNGIDLAGYINEIYKYLIAAGLVLAGIMFALGGFQYLTGNIQGGKGTIKNSILGLVLLISSYTILQIVNPEALNLKVLGVEEIKRDPFNGETDTSDPPGSRSAIHADCSSIPGPTAPLPSGVTPPAGKNYDFNRYKNIKGFNPMCVLSDKALEFDSSYDVTKIQNLLESRNSILAKLKIGDKTIAQVIYNAAKANNISPQILLLKLQKEQGLLSNKALQSLLGVSKLSDVTDTMISNLDKRLAAKDQTWEERIKTNMLNFATGFEWRTGETRLMTRTAAEINELGGADGKNFRAIEKQIIGWATGVLEAYKVDGWEGMSLGERYIRARIIAYNNKKLNQYFGEINYSASLTTVQIFGGLDKQIYMTAYSLGRCGSTKVVNPLDYVGAIKNTESSRLHAIQAICPGNRMTACLYSYTPHVSAQYTVIQVWKSLGFDQSYIFPESECSSVPSAWLQIGK